MVPIRKGLGPMDRTATEGTITICLSEIRQRLEQATGMAKAAEACAASGQVDQGVEVSLGIEQPCYEATRLLDAVSLLKRLSND